MRLASRKLVAHSRFMLKTLYIKNYALIEELNVEFERGLNIITGETGAGKSIIIDALSLILGERADTDAVRKGADKAIVEALFSVSENGKLKKLLKENEIENSGDLILRREISMKGQSRCFINDTPSTIMLLKQVGDLLVDLHGQHEHQSLLRTDTHIQMLDNFGGLEGLVKEFRESYHKVLALLDRIDELKSKKEQLMERRALYEFQIKEIDEVNPQSGEEEQLEAELTILENSEKLFSASERLYQLLYEGDNAVHDQLVLVRNQLEDLASIDKLFEESKNEAGSAAAIVSELAKFIQSYNSKVEFNPARLEEIRTRLGQLTLLKKKYGGSLDAVIDHREKIGGEVSLAENFDAEINGLEQQREAERKVCSEIAQRLSAKRRDIAKKVNRSIEQALVHLGIANPAFETVIENRKSSDPDHAIVKLGKEFFETSPSGIDIIEFYISTNVGEDVKPLAKVASGGEISRIMLALKTILAKTDQIGRAHV
jgi:DNA repair protein RecN (Recombination protein N)